MWDTSRPAVTAEWNCTRCGTTNRKLVAPGDAIAHDRCVHCKLSHRVTLGATPVRWDARVER